MEEKSTYRTLKTISEGIYKEKGSKFIAYAVPCYTEKEAKEYLDKWRRDHYQSRHVCYAYRFGVDQKVYRANDDGEPNNSAGAPILGQIQSFDLSNVLIGVVRYFGGTKLGVGGLIHAYKSAAKEAIENGEICELEVFDWFRIHFEYPAMPQVMNLLKLHNLVMKEQQFEETCSLVVNFPLNKSRFIQKELEDMDSVECESMGIY